ncbi:MAG: UDP-3-O-(3-hydroxymyristoyl)glucosamine N-acyltransferase [Bacteroidia bacterium]|nr:MAG: UDP-3-O-(3-hydroxymyristoyl)glucosamine N-acyltransferase [Bacteroidia bacterium]
MKFTARTIAGFLEGEIEGNPDVEVTTISKIEEGVNGSLSFLANPLYEKFIYTTGSSIVLVNRNFIPSAEIKATLIKVDNAYDAFASLLTLYQESLPKKHGIHPTAVIEKSAKIGDDVYIGPLAYIGENVVIGDRCQVYSHVSIETGTRVGKGSIFYSGVKIYHDTDIGKNCIVHAGTVIGSDGFGFAPQSGNDYKKIPQIGIVVIEDNVEIGANVVIDRATVGSTIIHRGVKLDNLIQIGHNVDVGENTVMAAQTGIAGSTKIGRNCMFGGQVGIIGHITIADGTKIAAQSGVSGPIKEAGKTVYGSPAFDFRDFQKSYIVFRRLPELKSKVDKLEKDLKGLSKS